MTATEGGSPNIERPILAIELSQRSGGAAVIDAAGDVHTVAFEGGRRDRDDVLPGIHAVLARADVPAATLRSVAVDVGPGGFTGLRISIAAAQAIAEVARATVVGVPGAVVAATATPSLGGLVGEIVVLSAAKAGTAWRTRLGRDGIDEGWRIIGDPGIIDRPDDASCEAVIADEHVPAELLRSELAGSAVHPPSFDAAAVARIALAGGHDLLVHSDPARLMPIYPREPEAVRRWRDRPAR